ncbi:hypothetical protein POX_h09509 [Penicillium oxalicum]|uniref:Uncharacterized protein n=1 Tax=Penicillium oxalicum (strain 114-2 / CGMCC 5302) TaxID=933388 RepID=S7ZKN9_PENO1|nr:hypothetical protein POX_h09509 [Penicillium oxalicum]EPS31210.1 hypothetical protein PDE_06165 [Penicillium oxalicum 114-2]KAI2785750.1 hypothetical protein POX_h09509 [Penicillium oxalicum]
MTRLRIGNRSNSTSLASSSRNRGAVIPSCPGLFPIFDDHPGIHFGPTHPAAFGSSGRPKRRRPVHTAYLTFHLRSTDAIRQSVDAGQTHGNWRQVKRPSTHVMEEVSSMTKTYEMTPVPAI